MEESLTTIFVVHADSSIEIKLVSEMISNCVPVELRQEIREKKNWTEVIRWARTKDKLLGQRKKDMIINAENAKLNTIGSQVRENIVCRPIAPELAEKEYVQGAGFKPKLVGSRRYSYRKPLECYVCGGNHPASLCKYQFNRKKEGRVQL